MAGEGYQGSLFDSAGPRGYADALGQVSTQMTKVVTSFDTLGTKSTSSLTSIGKQFDDLISKAGQFKSLVAGIGGPAGKGGGKGSGWSPGPTNTGSTGGQGGDTMGIGGDHGQPASQSSRMTSAQNGGDQDAPTSPTAPGTRGGAVMAIGSAAAGAAQRWVGANQGAMMESSITGQQFANYFGGGRGSYQVIPNIPGSGGQPAYTQGGAADYYQAQRVLTFQMGVIPQRQGAPPGQNAQMFGNALNTAMLMDPGLSRAGGAQAFAGMYTGQATQSLAAVGITARSGGKDTDPNTIFEQIFQKTYPSPGLQAILTQDDILNALTPGGPLEKNFESAGLDPNSETFTLFQQYVLGRQSWASKSPANMAAAQAGKLPQTGAAMNKAFKLDQGPAAASIKKGSALAQAQSMLYPAASTASEHLDNAATALLKAVTAMGGGSGIGKAVTGGLGGLLGLSGPLAGAVNIASAALPLILGGGPTAGINSTDLTKGGPPKAGGGGGPTAGLNSIDLTKGGSPQGGAVPTSTAQRATTIATTASPMTSSTLGQADQVATLTSMLATASRPTASGTFDWYGTLTAKAPTNAFVNYSTGSAATGGSSSSSSTTSDSTSTDGSSTDSTSSGDPNGMLAGLGVGIDPSLVSGAVPKTSDFMDEASALYAVGFRGAALQKMLAISIRESGGVPSAHNGNASTGDDSWGWFQINYIGNMLASRTKEYGSPQQMISSPMNQARAAWKLSAGGTNWAPWNTPLGLSQSYMDKAAGYITKAQGMGILTATGPTGYDLVGKATGSYDIEQNKIALLHAGERVIPAADNFSVGDRYQSGGGGDGSTHYHLHFQPQSVQLVTAPGTSAADLRDIAQKFMDSVSKPQIIQSVRSS